jgi:hypothetical protein
VAGILDNPYNTKLGTLKDETKDLSGKEKRRHKTRIGNVKAKSYLWDRNNQFSDLPLDAGAIQEKGASQRKYNTSKNSFNTNTTNLKNNYGFGDTANPYSQAAFLQKNYDQKRQGTINSSAASGQLYAGSMQSQQDADLSAFEQGHASLRSSFNDAMALENTALRTAGDLLEDENATTDIDNLGRATAADVDDPGAEPQGVKEFVASKEKAYLIAKAAGNEEKAAKIKKTLKDLDAWDQAEVKKRRKRMRDNGKLKKTKTGGVVAEENYSEN